MSPRAENPVKHSLHLCVVSLMLMKIKCLPVWPLTCKRQNLEVPHTT